MAPSSLSPSPSLGLSTPGMFNSYEYDDVVGDNNENESLIFFEDCLSSGCFLYYIFL